MRVVVINKAVGIIDKTDYEVAFCQIPNIGKVTGIGATIGN